MTAEEIAALRDPETINLFVEETMESLQRMESSLIRAEQGDPATGWVDLMFRQMHTLKASAAYLMFDKSRAVAHAAETLLARQRDAQAALSPAQVRVLLNTGDCLRALVQDIRRQGVEGGLDVLALIAALERSETPETLETPETPETLETPETPEDTEITVRVNLRLLDRIVHLATELVLARNQAVQQLQALAQDSAVTQNTCQRLSNLTTDLQEQVMKTRMQPVARIFERLPRVARDVAQATGKQVVTVMHDNATEIDRALFETIRDPILHAVRNAIDHGIETPEERQRLGKPPVGTLTLRAHHIGSLVTVEIEDDGRGMDAERLRAHALSRGMISAAESQAMDAAQALDLVFRPGFSTAAQITDVSGRGVGMDVVRNQLERAGGRVELETKIGQGTRVRLHMPLTLAVIPALLVRLNGQRYAVPQNHLVELVYLSAAQAEVAVHWVGGVRVLRLRGVNVPLVFLSDVLELQSMDAQEGDLHAVDLHVVIVASDSLRYALVVQQVENTEDIVIKPLRGPLRRHPVFGGVAVLGEGEVALILDVAGMGARVGLEAMSGMAAAAPAAAAAETQRIAWLVFEAQGTQCALPLSVVQRIEEVPGHLLETLAQQEILSYRNTFLPVIRLEQALPLGPAVPAPGLQTLLVLSFARPVALAVQSIIDVAEVSLAGVNPNQDMPGVLGQAVLFNRTTLMLDAYEVVRRLAPQVTLDRGTRLRGRVLLVEQVDAMRAALNLYLTTAGLDVVAVGSAAAAHACLGRAAPFAAVIADLDLPDEAGWGLAQSLAAEHTGLLVLGWTSAAAEWVAPRALSLGLTACINKLQREQVLAALQGLAAPC